MLRCQHLDFLSAHCIGCCKHSSHQLTAAAAGAGMCIQQQQQGAAGSLPIAEPCCVPNPPCGAKPHCGTTSASHILIDKPAERQGRGGSRRARPVALAPGAAAASAAGTGAEKSSALV